MAEGHRCTWRRYRRTAIGAGLQVKDGVLGSAPIPEAWHSKRDESFLSAKRENRVLLRFDSTRSKYIGYIVWYPAEHARLNQVFVVRGEQRKGYATRLIGYWVKAYVDGINQVFEIESPNEHSVDILVKLGYPHRRGDKVVGTKCLVFRGI